ncbi:MarR family transcriptional regulator [Rhodobacteraceae bacterium DSL-40]|uniref:MarR family winged helix-turn-helix transcriptional regulator n=1 Tax=Amaricoccus sp. B4 TaxID=3368557 RepID=UPI000DAB9E46
MQDHAISPRLQFGFIFVGLARRWRRALDERMAAIGLTDATWPPLVHLRRSGGGISQAELAARVGIDASSLVRLLDVLCGRGLIERRPAPDDRRTRALFLTAAGVAAVEAALVVLQAAEEEMLIDLDDAELAAMLRGFGRIEARIAQVREERGA